MKLDIFNIDKFIAENKCPEVTNPIFFNFDGSPTEDGLFSNELFGITDQDRRNIFGYIDLGEPFIHPLIFTMFRRMGNLKQIISGDKYAIIYNNKITVVDEDYPGAQTGMNLIYDNYEKIDWFDDIDDEETDSVDKRTRLKFLKSLKKDEFFVTKWLVLPPFYRDMDSENQSMGDEINSFYKDLINRSRSLKTGGKYSVFGDRTRASIQQLLVTIFDETTKPIKGKNSLLKNHLIGKNVDYTSSNVITAPDISGAETVNDLPVKFGSGSFPMATTLSLFNPFFVSVGTKFMESYLRLVEQLLGDEIKHINISQFTSEAVETMIKQFIRSEENRFDPVSFEYTNKKGEKVSRHLMIYEFRSKKDLNNNNYIERPFTFTDLFFMISKDVLEEKYAYVTRYPVINFQGIYPAKVEMMTTEKTRPEVWISTIPSNKHVIKFEKYPYIRFEGEKNPAPKMHYSFKNVMLVGNQVIGAMGGDYDGDMVYMKGLFTQEANQEAKRLTMAKSNFLNATGGPARGISIIGKEAVVSLYELTKEGF